MVGGGRPLSLLLVMAVCSSGSSSMIPTRDGRSVRGGRIILQSRLRHRRRWSSQNSVARPQLAPLFTRAEQRMGEDSEEEKPLSSSSSSPIGESKDPVTAFFNAILPAGLKQGTSRGNTVEGGGSLSYEEIASASAQDSQAKASGLTMEALCLEVYRGLQERSWFVTGQVDSRLFLDEFAFSDPSVSASSLDEYARGVARFFTQGEGGAVMQVIDVAPIDSSTIMVTWYLDARVNLPTNPRIKPYLVKTFYKIDEDTGLIRFQRDEFTIADWDVAASALLPTPPPQLLSSLLRLAAPFPPPPLDAVANVPLGSRNDAVASEWGKELKALLLAEEGGEEDANRCRSLVQGLISLPTTICPRDLDGSWRVIWEEGLLPWKAFRPRPQKASAYQDFSSENSTVRNSVNFLNGVSIVAEGAFSITSRPTNYPGSEAFVSPVLVEASIEGGAISWAAGETGAGAKEAEGKRTLKLPIQGKGSFEILYLDKELRIFRSRSALGGGVVVQVKQTGADTS